MDIPVLVIQCRCHLYDISILGKLVLQRIKNHIVIKISIWVIMILNMQLHCNYPSVSSISLHLKLRQSLSVKRIPAAFFKKKSVSKKTKTTKQCGCGLFIFNFTVKFHIYCIYIVVNFHGFIPQTKIMNKLVINQPHVIII